MADSKADVVVVAATWTNLYTASGIAVGTALDIWNKGSQAADIAIKATAPTTGTGVPLFGGHNSNHLYVSSGESGVWAFSEIGTRLSVQVG